MFVEQMRRKAESAGGKLIDLRTWSLKMPHPCHITGVCTKKPLSQRRRVLGDGSGAWVYSSFFSRRLMNNMHHPSHLESMWAAQKPVLLQSRGCVMNLRRLSLLAGSRITAHAARRLSVLAQLERSFVKEDLPTVMYRML